MSPSRLWLYKLLTHWLPESRFFWLKIHILRWAGAKIGNNVRVYSSASFFGTGSLEIGDDVHIGGGVLISTVEPATVKIGSHVDIAPQVMVLTGSHEINAADDQGDSLRGHMAGKGTVESVGIGDGCWLGARTLILPGVTLPNKTVTAAGAIVTTSPKTPKSLLAGVPAKVKKQY